MKNAFLVLFIITGFCLACRDVTDNSANMAEMVNNAAVKNQTPAKTNSIESIMKLPADFKPQYEIAGGRRSDFETYRRKVIYVVVPAGLKKEQIDQNFKAAIIETYNSEKLDAVLVWGYKKGDDVSGRYTVGEATFAPEGKWEKANDSAPLSDYQFVSKIRDEYLK